MKSCKEFSDAMDVLWNNISSDKAPGISEYEKSVFLTKAQNELVKNYFDAGSKGNTLGKGFDESAIRQMDFSTLLTSVSKQEETDQPIIDPRALVYQLPTDVLFIIHEEIALSKAGGEPTMRQVIPLHYGEYVRLMSKPFKEPLKWQAWRLLTQGSSTEEKTENVVSNVIPNNKVEIVLTSWDKKTYAESTERSYLLRYVRRPKPIILVNLTDYEAKIDGKVEESMCELPEGVHDAIVQRAVELAKIAWNGDSNETQLQMTAGQRSE